MTDSFDTRENPDFEDESSGSGKGGIIFALIIFIFLFAAAAGILVYQQVQSPGGFFTWDPGKEQESERVEHLLAENKKLEDEISMLNERIQKLESEAVQFEDQEWMSGTVYEVQIGAFKYFDMSWYDDNMVQMQMNYDNEYTYFTIGRFRNLDRARNFRDDIQRMGLITAAISKRIDGYREGIVY